MASRKNSKPPRNDFEYDEGEVCGFTDEAPIGGNCISSFSFEDDCVLETLKPNPEYKTNDNTTIASTNKTITVNNDTSTRVIQI